MKAKATQIGMFLVAAVILAVGTIYAIPNQIAFPIQQAMACGDSCGDKCCDGGSLVNVETDDTHVGHVNAENNNIGNVQTGDIASGNKIKFLNDNKFLNKNNVLSYNKILNNNKLKVNDVVDVLSENKIVNKIPVDVLSENKIKGNKVPIVSGNTLNAFKLLGCGC